MQRKRFPISSEALEILLAFSEAESLKELSKNLLRDSSVVSRHLQKLAEEHKVLEKKTGRWALTKLGQRLVEWTKLAIESQKNLFAEVQQKSLQAPLLNKHTALLLMGVQKGFEDPFFGEKSSFETDFKLEKILLKFREKNSLFSIPPSSQS